MSHAMTFMKTFETPTVPEVMTKEALDEAIAMTEMFHIVAIHPTRVASEENHFLGSVLDRNKAREVFELDADHPAFFRCTCTSKEFFETGSISEEIIMVFAFFKLIDIGVLTAQIVPRRARGRPKTVSSWSDVSGGPKAQDGALFLKDIERNPPLKYYQWRCVVIWKGKNVVGVLFACAKVDSTWSWTLHFPDFAGTKDEGNVDVCAIELAERLAKACEMGLGGPSPVAPPPS